jgi:hypothetical protein
METVFQCARDAVGGVQSSTGVGSTGQLRIPNTET